MPIHATKPDLHNKFNSYGPLQVIANFTGTITAETGSIIIDEEVDLSSYGIFATTYALANFGYIIEKQVNGVWVPTTSSINFSNQFTNDPDGYEFNIGIIPIPGMKLHNAPGGDQTYRSGTTLAYAVGSDSGRDWNCVVGARTDFPINPSEKDRVTKCRIIAARNDTIYDAGQQATIDAYGYRLRAFIHGISHIIWQKEFQIPATTGSVVANEDINLIDYGLTSNLDNVVMLAEIRRNGKRINTFSSKQYVLGERFDPPSPSIELNSVGVVSGNLWANRNNGTVEWTNTSYDCSEPISNYGDVTFGSQYSMDDSRYYFFGGTWVGPDFGFCDEPLKQDIHLFIKRTDTTGSAFTEYYNGALTESLIDLNFIDPTVTGTLIARSGVPAVYTDYPSYHNQVVTLKFTPQVYPLTSYPLGIPTYTWAWLSSSNFQEVNVNFVPGTTAMSAVFEALSSSLTQYDFITTGTLSTPGYVLQHTASFSASVIVSSSAIPIPSGSENNCSVLVTLLAAPPPRVGSYPFDDGNDFGYNCLRLKHYINPTKFKEKGLWTDGTNLHYSPSINTDYQFVQTNTVDGTTLITGSTTIESVFVTSMSIGATQFSVGSTYSPNAVTIKPPDGAGRLVVSGSLAEVSITTDNDNQVAGLEVIERAPGGGPGIHLMGLSGPTFARLSVNDSGNPETSCNFTLQASSSVQTQAFVIDVGYDSELGLGDRNSISSQAPLIIRAPNVDVSATNGMNINTSVVVITSSDAAVRIAAQTGADAYVGMYVLSENSGAAPSIPEAILSVRKTHNVDTATGYSTAQLRAFDDGTSLYLHSQSGSNASELTFNVNDTDQSAGIYWSYGQLIFDNDSLTAGDANFRLYGAKMNVTASLLDVLGNVNVSGALSLRGILNLSATANASPVDGDVWLSGNNVLVRLTGTTYKMNLSTYP